MPKPLSSSHRKIICRTDGSKIMINDFWNWKRSESLIGRRSIYMTAFVEMIR